MLEPLVQPLPEQAGLLQLIRPQSKQVPEELPPEAFSQSESKQRQMLEPEVQPLPEQAGLLQSVLSQSMQTIPELVPPEVF